MATSRSALEHRAAVVAEERGSVRRRAERSRGR
ncbi:hypothetical protein [Streptomyces lavendulae]